MAYIYGGDKVEVTYQLGPFWALVIGAMADYEIVKSTEESALAKAFAIQKEVTRSSPNPFLKELYPGYEAAFLATTAQTATMGTFAAVLTAGAIAFVAMKRWTVGQKLENTGETWPNRARFRIKYGNEGESFYTTDIFLYGVATSPYRKDVKIYLPPNPSRKNRVIKVYRLNYERNPVKEGEMAARYKDKMSLAAITEIVPTQLNYSNSVVIGTRVNARDVPSIPQRNYNLKLKKVAIPNNYNPETRKYSGNWNGLFLGQGNGSDRVAAKNKRWTDNPAWCLHDLIENQRYGVGKFGIKPEHIDKWTLYKIAKYCDQPVSTGYSSKFPKRKFKNIGGGAIQIEGIDRVTFVKEFSHAGKELALFFSNGERESIEISDVIRTGKKIKLKYDPAEADGECAVSIDYPLVEPRYTLNAMLLNSQNAFKLINEFASIFRAYAYWSGGAINFFQDEKKDPVMLFSNNNVSEEGFAYSSTPRSSRTNSCKIKYINKYNGYSPKMAYSEDRTSIQNNNIIEQTIDGFGITSPGQAKRASDFIVKTANLETEAVSFKTSSVGSYLRPGDVVNVLDDKRTIGRFGGKIIDISVSGDGKAAEIDIDFPIRTLIDEDNKDTWKNITIYDISGNQTIDSLNSMGEVSDEQISDMRASQIGQYVVSKISNNDTKLKLVNNPYSYITGQYTWTEALLDARSRGGMVAAINNDTDQALVQAVLPRNETGWIGGYNMESPPPEEFVWTQPQGCKDNAITYFSWAEGFPRVGDPIEVDEINGDKIIETDNLGPEIRRKDGPFDLITDAENVYGNCIAVSGSYDKEIHGDWVTLPTEEKIGYVLEGQIDETLLGLHDVDGTTFALEDSVNLAIPKSYKIMNIAEESPGVFAVQGMEYNAEKFENIESDASLEPPSSPVIFTEEALDAPQFVNLSAMGGSNGVLRLEAEWPRVVGAASYRAQFFNGNVLLATKYVNNDPDNEMQKASCGGDNIIEGGNYYVRVYSMVT